MSAQGVRYTRGKRWLFPVALTFTVAVIASLLAWQFTSSPNLQRSTLAQRANAQIEEVVSQSPLVNLVEANVRFTRADIKGQNTLLCVVYVQPREDAIASSEEIRSRLTQAIQTRLLQQNLNITPLIDVSVLELPTSN